MSDLKIDTVMQRYICAAVAHGEATHRGDYKNVNKQYAKLTKIYKMLEKDQLFAEKMFEILFRHENASVRMWASAHALGLNIKTDDAVKVLKKISEDQSLGIVRFDSAMTLAEWKKKGGERF